MRDEIQNNSMTASSAAGKITQEETQRSPGVGTTACCSEKLAENDPQDLKTVPKCCEQPVDFSNPRAYLMGVLASFAIVGIYLGMNTLTSDWYFARVQFSEYRWWIISLAIGLGIQVALYTLFRAHHRGKKKTAAISSMAASGGVSAVAMMACCSHYLATVIPLLGVSFLSATAVASLAQYQTYFFLAGMISSLFGIGLMIRLMVKHGMFRAISSKNISSFGLWCSNIIYRR
jgi:hypothetical protein